MIVMGDGLVWLEKGEVIPVYCKRGHIYQPDMDSEVSDCPQCRRVNIHGVCDIWKHARKTK